MLKLIFFTDMIIVYSVQNVKYFTDIIVIYTLLHGNVKFFNIGQH